LVVFLRVVFLAVVFFAVVFFAVVVFPFGAAGDLPTVLGDIVGSWAPAACAGVWAAAWRWVPAQLALL
jgi:hypothetical protein